VFQHVAVEPNADLLFRLRHDERRRGKPILIDERRRVGIVANRRLDSSSVIASNRDQSVRGWSWAFVDCCLKASLLTLLAFRAEMMRRIVPRQVKRTAIKRPSILPNANMRVSNPRSCCEIEVPLFDVLCFFRWVPVQLRHARRPPAASIRSRESPFIARPRGALCIYKCVYQGR
jgi:hypothetical protein